jgi:hypothetical protein
MAPFPPCSSAPNATREIHNFKLNQGRPRALLPPYTPESESVTPWNHNSFRRGTYHKRGPQFISQTAGPPSGSLTSQFWLKWIFAALKSILQVSKFQLWTGLWVLFFTETKICNTEVHLGKFYVDVSQSKIHYPNQQAAHSCDCWSVIFSGQDQASPEFKEAKLRPAATWNGVISAWALPVRVRIPALWLQKKRMWGSTVSPELQVHQTKIEAWAALVRMLLPVVAPLLLQLTACCV